MPFGKFRIHRHCLWENLLLVLALWLIGSGTSLADTVIVRDDLPRQPLTAQLERLEDPTRQLTIEQVAQPELPFAPVDADALNLGYTPSAYWFRLRLYNELASPVERFIEVEQPYLSRVEAYLPRADTEGFTYLAAGDSLPFALRAVRHRLPIFPITIPPHTEQTIYLRVETKGAFTFSATLWKLLEHGRKDRIHTFFLGAYYGFLLILLIYNAAFFFGIHDRTNIFFAGYVTCIGFFQACVDGFATQFQELLLGGYFVEGISPRLILGNLASGLAALFTRQYLLLETYSPRAHRWLGLLAVLFFGMAALATVAPTQTVAKLSTYLMALSALPALLSAIGPLRQGYRPALYFLLAWAAVVVAVTLNTLRTAGWLSPSIAWPSVVHFGTVAQGLFLSIGLVARVARLQEEKEAAQAEADRRATEVSLSAAFNEQLKLANEELNQALLAREEARREAEQRRAELEAANARLLELDRIKSEFTAMLVHDLRSPLAAVNGTLELIEGVLPNQDPDLLELVRASQDNVRRVLDLITDLLELARTESQSLTLDLKLLDLVPLLQGCVENTRLGAPHSLTFITDLPPALPAVAGDSRKLERAFMNLLTNAAKFTPPGGTVTVAAREVAGAGVETGLSFIEVAITDTGQGIPAAELPFLFDPYRQGSQGKYKVGFGLGLAIVKRIIAAHNGNVTVKSQVGVGSTFTVTLPCWASKVGQTSLTAPTPAGAGDSGESVLP